MKKMFFVIFGGPKLFCPEIEKSRRKQFLVQFSFLKKLISRGSPEVTFCSWTKFQRAYGRSTFSRKKKVREQHLILPAAHGQLEKTNSGCSDMDPGCSDMDSGHPPDTKCASKSLPGFFI